MKNIPWIVVAAVGLFSCGTNPADQPAAQSSDATPPRVIATIEVGRAHAIGAGAGAVWTANYEEGTVSLVDPSLNGVVETIGVDDELGSGPSDVHIVDQHVWLSASDSGTVGHLDPETLEVTVAADGGAGGIIDTAAAPGEVWLAQQSGKAMDPLTALGAEIKSANAQVPPPGDRFSIYSDIAAGDAGVWALDESEGTLAAISSEVGAPRVAATAENVIAGAQADIAVGHGFVWVETSDGATSRLTRFDPSTSKMDSFSVEGHGGIIAVGPEEVWLLTHEDERGYLWRVNPDTLEHDHEPLTLDGEFQLGDIAYGFGSVWVSHDTNLLTRIDISGSGSPSEPVPSPELRGDADVCDQTGPWSYCPEARWLRRVVLDAGLEVTSDTGTALQVIAGSHELYAWNANASRPVEEVASEGGYKRKEGSEAFTDGSRIVWEAQGLHIYLSSADEKSIDSIPNDIIVQLIEASRVVPMENDLAGAEPQPTPTGEQRFEEAGGGRVHVWPATEDVENEGKYLFNAPHCGLDWMIDFDASFWEAVKPDDYGNGDNYPFFFNSDEGTITFTGADAAVYQASTGEMILLKRLPGPITVDPCM